MKLFSLLILLNVIFQIPSTAFADCSTPLIEAIRTRKVELVQSALNQGEDVNRADCKGRYPLHFAAEAGSIEVLKLMLSRRPSLEVRDGEGSTPLMASVTNADFAEGTRSLLEAGAKPNQQDHATRSALLQAVYLQNVDAVKVLAHWGSTEIDQRTEFKPQSDCKFLTHNFCTPLQAAADLLGALNADARSIRLQTIFLELLKAKADPNLYAREGYPYSYSSLSALSKVGYYEGNEAKFAEFVREIRRVRPDVDLQPLVYRSQNAEHIRIFAEEFGLDLNIEGPYGRPLNALCGYHQGHIYNDRYANYLATLEAYLRHGANPALSARETSDPSDSAIYEFMEDNNISFNFQSDGAVKALFVVEKLIGSLPLGLESLTAFQRQRLFEVLAMGDIHDGFAEDKHGVQLYKLLKRYGAKAGDVRSLKYHVDQDNIQIVRFLVDELGVNPKLERPLLLREAVLNPGPSMYQFLLWRGAAESDLGDDMTFAKFMRGLSGRDETFTHEVLTVFERLSKQDAFNPNAMVAHCAINAPPNDPVCLAWNQRTPGGSLIEMGTTWKALSGSVEMKRQKLRNLLSRLQKLGVDFNRFQAGKYSAHRPLDFVFRTYNDGLFKTDDWVLAEYLSFPGMEWGSISCDWLSRHFPGPQQKDSYPLSLKLVKDRCQAM